MSIPEPNPAAELVVMAPMQIKPRLSMGNIYDLTIIDFYAKARRFAGADVVVPFLWNINGKPLLDQIRKEGGSLSPASIQAYIDMAIRTISGELAAYGLDYDFVVRDDEVLDELTSASAGAYKDALRIGKAPVNECPSCRGIFGSDPAITTCKHCGARTKLSLRTTLHLLVQTSSILAKLERIAFLPLSGKDKLLDFVHKLPASYSLILEKDRENTLSLAGYLLDPRFVAIMLPALIRSSGYKRRVWIHGDVVKKLDYYGLCYLNDADCPTDILIHGIIQDATGKKIRWQETGGELAALAQLNKKIARALLLTSNVTRDRTLSSERIDVEARTLTKLYVKIGRILEARNRSQELQGIRPELAAFVAAFNQAVSEFNYRDAYITMVRYVDSAWKTVRTKQLSGTELETLRSFRSLYFGH